jgi:hypothetical protein
LTDEYPYVLLCLAFDENAAARRLAHLDAVTGLMPAVSRTALGSVACPFTVTLVLMGITSIPYGNISALADHSARRNWVRIARRFKGFWPEYSRQGCKLDEKTVRFREKTVQNRAKSDHFHTIFIGSTYGLCKVRACAARRNQLRFVSNNRCDSIRCYNPSGAVFHVEHNKNMAKVGQILIRCAFSLSPFRQFGRFLSPSSRPMV